MKITFLGTGTSQGVPVIGCQCEACLSDDPRDDRLRSSIHIDIDGTSIVIDTGPDFRQQMLRHRIGHLDGIFITHEHNDHVIGLDDIRAYNFLQRSDIPLYAEEGVIEVLCSRFSYVFGHHQYPGVPKVTTHVISPHEPFKFNNHEFIPIRVMHGKLPIVGFRVGAFSYITDASYIDDEAKSLLADSDILVINALRKEDHHSHFTLQEAVDMSVELRAKKTYLIHISHHMGKTKKWEQDLPLNVVPAHDGMVLTLES